MAGFYLLKEDAGQSEIPSRCTPTLNSKLNVKSWTLNTPILTSKGAREALERRLEGIEELEGADIVELVEGVKQAKAATSETLHQMEKNRLALRELRRREVKAKASREAKRCDLDAIRGEISELDAERAVIISLFAGWEREVAAGGKEGADWRDAQREMFRAMEEDHLKVGFDQQMFDSIYREKWDLTSRCLIQSTGRSGI